MPEPTQFEKLAAERAVTRERYPVLFDRVRDELYRHDPMGIRIGDNPDEYDAEAGTIIPRLQSAADIHDVEWIIREEMAFWFGDAMAEPEEGFAALAREVWEAWQAQRID